MGWFKVDDHYFEHYKVLEAGPTAADLNLRGIAYCSRNQSDGKIPKAAVQLLNPGRDVADDITRLLDAGLWRETQKFFVIHDYLEHQSSRAQIRDKQKSARDRKRKSRTGHTVTHAAGHTNVSAPDVDAEADVDTDIDTEADRPITRFKDSSLTASVPQPSSTQSSDEVDPAVVRELFAGVGKRVA